MSPGVKKFEDELETRTILDIQKALEPVKRTFGEWLKLAGFVVGLGSVALTLATTQVQLAPVPLALLGIGATKDVVVPGLEWVSSRTRGTKPTNGGLHYLMKFR